MDGVGSIRPTEITISPTRHAMTNTRATVLMLTRKKTCEIGHRWRVGPVSKTKPNPKKKTTNRRRWDSTNRPRIDKTTIHDTLTLAEYKKHRG